MAWGYFLPREGRSLAHGYVAAYAGDPSRRIRSRTALANHPQYVGYFTDCRFGPDDRGAASYDWDMRCQIDQPPAIVEQVKPGKQFSVHYGRGGWWAHIEGHAYPFGAWRMDRGPLSV